MIGVPLRDVADAMTLRDVLEAVMDDHAYISSVAYTLDHKGEAAVFMSFDVKGWSEPRNFVVTVSEWPEVEGF